MIGCIGYIPNISLDEDIPDLTDPAIAEFLDKKNFEFTGIQSSLFSFDQDNKKLYILAQTGHPAWQMNEYLQYYIKDTEEKQKLQVLVKLRPNGAYSIGLVINPKIPLRRQGVDEINDSFQVFEEKPNIVFIHSVPAMTSNAGDFLKSQLSPIMSMVRNGEKIETYFMWHDLMPGELTQEKINFDIELFRPQKVELIFNTALEQTWSEAVKDIVMASMDGYDNVRPYIITTQEQ